MPRFRRKTEEFDAEQYQGEKIDGICHCVENYSPHVHTPKGLIVANKGDWIVPGKEEFYLIGNDKFLASYEPVEKPKTVRKSMRIPLPPFAEGQTHWYFVGVGMFDRDGQFTPEAEMNKEINKENKPNEK